MLQVKKRSRVGLLVESGELREVQQFCALMAYGADAACPYLAYEALFALQKDGRLPASHAPEKLVHAYIKAIGVGILKTMAKMGISTLASYKGAQIFEALGLGDEVVDACFKGTPSRIGGVNFEQLGADAMQLHALAYGLRFADDSVEARALPNPGEATVGEEWFERCRGGCLLFTPCCCYERLAHFLSLTVNLIPHLPFPLVPTLPVCHEPR